ncbi:MAG: M1 family peptidase [Bacteroidetes bacterium]|nr:M1 family peptidase [Bacteroidota bacterium]
MMKKFTPLFFCATLLFLTVNAQHYNDQGPENNFQSASNPYYWKNRTPHGAYWQQDVHYRIKASINDSTNIITGTQQLTYTNNSPDTLYFLFFNMYQNAFQPGSYLDNLQKNNGEKVRYGKYEKMKLGIEVSNIRDGGDSLITELDNTVMKVFLKKPILPGSSRTLDMRFTTYYENGSTRRRMKSYQVWQYKHFNGCQWFPKICVYDSKSGWNTDQHLGREFYGDFGTYDVDLTFPNDYILEATGVLQNESEVLPDSLKKKLDIYNFKDKKWDSKPDTIVPHIKGATKTWRYHAENVHDFAFTADPTYRIHDTIIYPGRMNGGGVRCVAIVQEPHASKWQNAAEYLAQIIHVFSRDFGVFEYPKIVVADASDGMEYPMLTLDGGKDPDYRGLLVHEVGHNWFYGMLGNNETYRAFMDEGFTQFLTAWGLEAIDGDTLVHDRIKNCYVRKFSEPNNPRDRNCYVGYLSDAIRYDDSPLNTHSDGFGGALGHGGGYRHVYFKTATMLYNLQYVLGDSLFSAAIKNYVAQWKFAHPYPEDFRNSITHFTHADLKWFFDQWMETIKNIDYKIGCVHKGKEKDQYHIRLKRKGKMQMPIDLQVISKDGTEYNYHIPNTWFEKSVTADRSTVLPKWQGWDLLYPTYDAVVTIPGGIKNVIIDPSNRLADINMLDNRKKGKVEFRFDSRIYPATGWKKYRIYMRPDIWWNAYDGFKVGFNLHGNYFNVKHNFSFTAWMNTHLAQGRGVYNLDKTMNKKADWFSYRFTYSNAIDQVIPRGTFYLQSQCLDGLQLNKIGLSKQFPAGFSADLNVKAFTRPRQSGRNYLLYSGDSLNPPEWNSFWTEGKKVNLSVNLTGTYSYNKRKINGYITAHLRSGVLTPGTGYHYLEVTNVLTAAVWKFDFRTRIFGRIAPGTNMVSESALYFAGGNPEEMMDSKYYRAVGFVPQSWADSYGDNINHLHFAGGLNMRGYSGYRIGEVDVNGVVQNPYKGNSGASINAEIDFNRIVPVKSKWLREHFMLNTYLFGDAGSIAYINSNNRQQWSSVRVDAGVGAAFTIKKFGPLQGIKPLTFRFDVPFYVSHTPFVSDKNFDFRWVVAISRTF